MTDHLSRVSQCQLSDLIEQLSEEWAALPISGVQLDSRQVLPGDLFIALQGSDLDGNRFIDDAVDRGAVAVLSDREEDSDRWHLPVIFRPQLRAEVGSIAAKFYNTPSQDLPVIGVTGTNGKSSITLLIAQWLEALDKPCPVMGTLGNGRPDNLQPSPNTTPDAVTVQRLLAEWRDGGAAAVAMEVSSHALVQERVSGVQFTAAVFSNLSHDHLDYHGSWEAYRQAKRRLFENDSLQFAVINADDDSAAEMRSALRDECRCISLSVEGGDADVVLLESELSLQGMRLRWRSPWGEFECQSALLGDFNRFNLLAAWTTLVALDHDPQALIDVADQLRPVPGRLQLVREYGWQGAQVVVDYAHTPDALDQALASLSHLCDGQLWCVIGCGGDRDRAKRAEMAAIARRRADQIVFTSDNPRSEDPQSIIDEMCAGIEDPADRVEVDRRSAIEWALQGAGPEDCVLIAGKGHERYQEIGGRRLPFDDVAVARAMMRRRAGS